MNSSSSTDDDDDQIETSHLQRMERNKKKNEVKRLAKLDVKGE